jgi:hypothetical protein
VNVRVFEGKSKSAQGQKTRPEKIKRKRKLEKHGTDEFYVNKKLHFWVMTIDEFTSSLSHARPPEGLSNLLQAMWYDGKDDWDTAHNIAQDIPSPEGSWIHAYLHRREGDDSNAAYWYRRAGKPMPRTSLQEEWSSIVAWLLE